MNEALIIALIIVTFVGVVTTGICLKLIKKQNQLITSYKDQVFGLQTLRDELRMKIQMMEEASAQANSITTADAAVAELSKPRAKRSRKNTGN